MIQKMNKLTFLVFHKEYNSFLKKLQELGVVHVQVTEDDVNRTSASLQEKQQKLSHIETVLEELSTLYKTKEEKQDSTTDIDSILTRFDNLKDKSLSLKQDIQRVSESIAQLTPWGEYSKEDIKRLQDIGYVVTHFICAEKAFDEQWVTDYNATEINRVGGKLYFVTVTRQDEDVVINAEREILPDSTLSAAQSELNKLTKQQEEIQNDLLALTATTTQLQKAAERLKADIDFDNVVMNTVSVGDDKLMILQGWFPIVKEESVKNFLESSDIYYEISEPTKEDNVPILLKNNCWTRMYECLTKMYGSPKYEEFDPTPIVAPFFTLFFAICMGDSGYGLLLMLIGALIATDKLKIEMFKGLGPLIISLGVATFIVGFFLGTFFGLDLTQLSFIPESWRGSVLDGNGMFLKGEVAGYDIQMVMAIVIGVVHLCLAMIIKAIVYTKNEGISSTISTWGWLILVLGSVITGVLVLCNTLSDEMTRIVLIAIGAISALAIFIFNNPKRNPLINIGAGLWDTYGMVTGLGGDVLSYIRLYALGLAGGMLGAAFNSLGLMVLGEQPNVGTWVGAVVIFIIGHLLNLAMSALGAFVHPLRLTFVEYFKNSGYEGTGTEYKPFKN